MKWLPIFLLLYFSAVSQNEQLAQNYYDKGDFEKARISYEELLKLQPYNNFYFQRLIDSYQQLKQYDLVKKSIEDRLDKLKQPSLLVELGYNYELQKEQVKAKKHYEEALSAIKKNPGEVYSIAAIFERRSLLEYALTAYKTARDLQPGFNFNYQMAVLYGQLGNHDMMISTFLDEAYANQNSLVIVQSQLSRFINEDAEQSFVEQLRKALLLRAQKNQEVFWNQFLSWFFVQQKEYGKAFIQEKAIYKRNPESFSNIVNLAQMAIEDNQDDTAREILAFVLANTNDPELRIQSHYFLIQIKIADAAPADYPAIEVELERLLAEFGRNPYTLQLQLIEAHFLAFNIKNTQKAKDLLQMVLEMPLNKFQVSDVKMELADILLLEEKFNQALLYYSQIEEDMKNDAIGHEASFKAARTSYFKEDFDWAQKQCKELKSASSQLIANDALEYFLLLSDNTAADSTHTALKKFARADYLLYQKKNKEALALFQQILKEHQGQEIEAVTLLRTGQLFELENETQKALDMYQMIINKYADCIYVDEALFYAANMFRDKLGQPDKAKEYYEKVLFNHQDSIYFVEARKRFRQLRGDTNL
jgi:tetratricopeptide (TPR) repeat protein